MASEPLQCQEHGCESICDEGMAICINCLDKKRGVSPEPLEPASALSDVADAISGHSPRRELRDLQRKHQHTEELMAYIDMLEDTTYAGRLEASRVELEAELIAAREVIKVLEGFRARQTKNAEKFDARVSDFIETQDITPVGGQDKLEAVFDWCKANVGVRLQLEESIAERNRQLGERNLELDRCTKEQAAYRGSLLYLAAAVSDCVSPPERLKVAQSKAIALVERSKQVSKQKRLAEAAALAELEHNVHADPTPQQNGAQGPEGPRPLDLAHALKVLTKRVAILERDRRRRVRRGPRDTKTRPHRRRRGLA